MMGWGPCSHLLFVGSLLAASTRALTTFLLDRHHEAPMLAGSFATCRPGEGGSQDTGVTPTSNPGQEAKGVSSGKGRPPFREPGMMVGRP